MQEIAISLVILAIGGIISYIVGRWGRPWVQSVIDTNYEKLALDKARRMAIIAKDMVRKKQEETPETELSYALIDELLEGFLNATQLSNTEVAKRVLASAIKEEKKDK
jgi:hypothetical protein